MLGELGQLALCFALALSLVMAIAGLMGAGMDAPNALIARRIASASTLGMMVFVVLAFGTLVTAFVGSDFSIADVANNSHTLKPLIYKITGVGGNHQGCMLLWGLVLSLYAGAVAGLQRGGERLTSAALGVQGLLAAAFLLFNLFTSHPFLRLGPAPALGVQGLVAPAFLLFILFTSNPFLRLDPAPFEGAGLNPLLQDPGLAFHPPMLYFGYVGLSASFSYAAAALIVGDDANLRANNWAR